MGVVDEVVIALNGRNWLATALGFIAGGVVPVATYLEAHHDVDPSRPLHAQVTTYLVLGGLVFSAKTVFRWATRAFADGWKAAGFVVLLEGVMITSHVPVLPLVLLAILVAVNGIATGCTLSVERSRARNTPPKTERADAKVVPLAAARHSRAGRQRDELVTAAAAIPRPANSRRRLRSGSAQENFSFELAPSAK
jgi:hypothetical protein